MLRFKKRQISCLPSLLFTSIIILILSTSITKVYSAQIALGWEANREIELAGYKIYYGNSSGNYDSSIDVGNQTSYIVTGLTIDETYFFAVKAYDIFGLESDYSEETVVTVSYWLNSFRDDFSTNTTGDYQLYDISTDGGTGLFLYDEGDNRVQVLTGDDVGLQFSHELTPLDTGMFKIDFQPVITIEDQASTVTQAALGDGLEITPDIKANNSDGPIKVDEELLIEINLSVDAENISRDADWWLVASTPTGEFEHYDLSQGDFTSGLLVTYQGALFDLDSYVVSIDKSGLATGTYTYYFGVDLDMNGELGGLLYYDSVEVTVVDGGDGDMSILLQQDINNYYEIRNTDGLEYGYVAKVVGGQTVEFEIFENGYLQDNDYQIKITFSPEETTVDAFGKIITINTDSSNIMVNSFFVNTVQQDAYYDNIEYYRYNDDNTGNRPPITIYDTTITGKNTPVTIDVINNDIDIEGTVDPATVVIVSGPALGTVVVNDDGTVTYTPYSGLLGTDTFWYTVQDNEGATSAEAVVAVIIPNQPPHAVDDSGITGKGIPVNINVIANDTDFEDTIDPATVAIVTEPANGTVAVNGDGVVTYTPYVRFEGTDTFTYTVKDIDGEASKEAIVAIEVM